MKIIIEHDDGSQTEYEVFSVTKVTGQRRVGAIMKPIPAAELRAQFKTKNGERK